ncbi:MAG: serine kinase [Nitrospiraceae bacterium]
MNRYTAYGLSISSTLPLPELVRSEAAANVSICFGKVDGLSPTFAADERYFQASASTAYLFWRSIGTFLIQNGETIIVDPAADVEEAVLRLFILGPALAVLLHQRGYLILHASAVEANGEAIAFLGGSGWGKSTMAASLYARGRKIIADDVVAVQLDSTNGPTVPPGFPQLKLWPDSIDTIGLDSGSLPRVHPELEKRACRVPLQFSQSPLPLAHIYVLGKGANHSIEPLDKSDALVELVRHSYGVRLLQPTNAPEHFLRCANLARTVPVRRLNNLHSLSSIPELAKIVEKDLV